MLKQLDTLIEGVIVGVSDQKNSSTVVDLSQGEIRILREGPITEEALKKEAVKYLEKA